MLRASEKEPEGRERKGGGKGRGVRLAKRAKPVSNLNGRLGATTGPDGGGLGGRFGGCVEFEPSGGGVKEGPALLSVLLSFESSFVLENMDGYKEKCRGGATVGYLEGRGREKVE